MRAGLISLKHRRERVSPAATMPVQLVMSGGNSEISLRDRNSDWNEAGRRIRTAKQALAYLVNGEGNAG